MLKTHVKKLQSFEQAVATATLLDKENHTYSGGVYTAGGELIAAAQRPDSRARWKSTTPSRYECQKPKVEIEDNCIYMGHYTTHYGHFLLETLSRFWALEHADHNETLVFHPFTAASKSPHRYSPARTCLKSFGIEPKRVLIIKKETRFARLLAPTSLTEINVSADPTQAEIYRQIGDYCESLKPGQGLLRGLRPTNYPARLFLSRKRLKRRRLTNNEAAVESIFRSRGFSIIYPEKLSFDEQVRHFRRAEIIAGFSGSAMHNSVFARPETQVITLGTGRNPKAPNPNQQTCDELSGCHASFIPFQGRLIEPNNDLAEVDTAHLTASLSELLTP